MAGTTLGVNATSFLVSCFFGFTMGLDGPILVDPLAVWTAGASLCFSVPSGFSLSSNIVLSMSKFYIEKCLRTCGSSGGLVSSFATSSSISLGVSTEVFSV